LSKGGKALSILLAISIKAVDVAAMVLAATIPTPLVMSLANGPPSGALSIALFHPDKVHC